MEGGRNFTEGIKYKCGGCLFICSTILDLHFHLIQHIEGGNYFFDIGLRTAYPRYSTTDCYCQTIEQTPLLINSIKQEFIDQVDRTKTVSEATQTDTSLINITKTDPTDNDERAGSIDSINFDMLPKDDVQKEEYSTIDTVPSFQESDHFDKQESNDETINDEKTVKVEEISDYTNIIYDRKRKNSSNSTHSHVKKKKKKKSKEKAFKKSQSLIKYEKFPDGDKGDNSLNDMAQQEDEYDESEDDIIFDDSSAAEKKMYSCAICNSQIGSRQAWEIHVELSHYHVYPFQCEVCYFPCHDQDELAMHNCSLASSESHECVQCPDKKQFKYKCNLLEHIDVEHDQRYPFNCETCDIQLISELEKRKHMTKHDPSLLVCGYCNKKMRTIGELESHLPNHTGETKFHCHICDKKYRKKAYLRDHIFRIHASEDSKQCICEKCGSSFAHSKVLYDHLRSSCGEAIYECELCDKKFCQKSSLKYHIRNHTGERPFICDFCGDTFMYSNTLSSHIKHRHTNDRQFKCSMCEKSFVKLCTLQRHERVHLKIKMYTCEYCKKEFSTNWNLKAHMRQHTGATPYTCTTCGLGFAHNVVRKTHEAKCKGVTFS